MSEEILEQESEEIAEEELSEKAKEQARRRRFSSSSAAPLLACSASSVVARPRRARPVAPPRRDRVPWRWRPRASPSLFDLSRG